ncbi:MAG: hypothetical protein LBM98_01630 [Oscillospiraceae bacterium]|nr:hypothetical protein [Oscillospiraceae bacterium]
MRSTGTPTIRRTLQVRSNPVPGGQHTVYVSQDYYVNPGLLRRISLTTYRKCGGGFAKTGLASPSPAPGRRTTGGASPAPASHPAPLRPASRPCVPPAPQLPQHPEIATWNTLNFSSICGGGTVLLTFCWRCLSPP